MSEMPRPSPAVEIRATFTPGERIRNLVIDLLDPSKVDRRTRESLRAALLFSSYRRRLIAQDVYDETEVERHGSVKQAIDKFEKLRRLRIGTDATVSLERVAPDARTLRLFMRPLPGASLDKVDDIMSSIPSSEYFDPGRPLPPDLFFVELQTAHMASLGDMKRVVDREQKVLQKDPSLRAEYDVHTLAIVKGSVTARLGGHSSPNDNHGQLATRQ